QRVIDVASIWQEHSGNGPPVLVEDVSLKSDLLSEYKLRRRLLGSLPVGLTFLRAVNAVEPDTFRALVVQDFDGLAVENRDCISSVSELNRWSHNWKQVNTIAAFSITVTQGKKQGGESDASPRQRTTTH